MGRDPAVKSGRARLMSHYAVAACMKNEGAFIIEWVAHYLALGFDRVIVVTNDCDDGTDLIADRLAQLAPVTHLRNDVPEGGFAQESGMALLKSSDELAGVDWLLHCDADELLYLHMPDPDIGRFIADLPECDAVAFDWRFAGTDLDAWPGGLVVDHCPRGSDERIKFETFSKTMFRPELFGFFSDHMPKAPLRDGIVVRNSLGEELPNAAMYHPRKSRFIRGTTDHMSWQAAEMRHYALRARQAFAIKALRGFGINPVAGKYRIGSQFWRNANRKDVALAINPLWYARLRGHVDRFLADPDLAALQAEAVAAIARKMTILEGHA